MVLRPNNPLFHRQHLFAASIAIRPHYIRSCHNAGPGNKIKIAQIVLFSSLNEQGRELRPDALSHGQKSVKPNRWNKQ